MKRRTSTLLKIISIVLCTVPPAAVTMYYCPEWYRNNRVEMVIPAFAVIAFCFSAIPLIKWVAQKIKTPSAWMMWTGFFAVLFALEKIIEQMVIISLAGAIGNILGAILWKVACKGEKMNE